jgi:penicillin-binding protein 1A
MNFLKLINVFFISLFAIIAGALFFIVHNQRIDFSVLEHYNPGKPSIVLDDEGNEWARFQLDRREPVLLSEVPKHLISAFIAAEDHYFWSHNGVSWKGIIRSLLVNCYHGKIVQGASTITQQLVKLLFFDSRKTMSRKLKEQFFSLLVERQFSKEHILQTYLNHVYFGFGIYGIEAASRRFWGKSASELSLDQAALLAGIVKSPAQYCPLLYPLSAQKRRNIVLSSMKNLGFINDTQFDENKNQSVNLVVELKDNFAPHAKESIRVFLEHMFGKEKLYTGGLRIQTTLNKNIQKQANIQFNEHIIQVKESIASDIDGGLLCMHGKSGEIKALVGGFDYSVSQFNRALQAKRQFGSIFKTIVYAAALEAGMTFADTEVDEPFVFESNRQHWEPKNSTGEFEGEMTLARALSRSNNIITIKTLLNVGVQKVFDLAKKFHLPESMQPYPSLALGCFDGTLHEALGMFNVFANNGMYIEPHLIKWVKNEWGTKIWKKSVTKERVLSSEICGQVTKVLGIGMHRMRWRYPDEWVNCDAIGKTGTTNDCRTCWFCGATPTYTTALYLGCDDNQSLGKNIFPVRTAVPIWLGLNRIINHEKTSFSYDPSLKEILIDSRTGQVQTKRTATAFTILVPEQYA